MALIRRALKMCLSALALVLAAELALVGPVTSRTAPVVHDPGYVALGDSFSSGAGGSPLPPSAGAPATCYRSRSSYAWLLGRDAVVPRPAALYACSGEQAADMARGSASTPGEKPQLARLTRSTRLVTITVGGNDADVQDVLTLCLALALCVARSTTITRRIGSLGPTLTGLYRRLRRSAPDARILVVGYPDIFPASGSAGCVLLSSPAVRYLDAWQAQLNDVIARSAGAAGVEFVDTTAAFLGHEVCARDSFVTGLPGRPPFHPNAVGHAALTRTLEGYLRAHGPAAG